MERDLTSGSVLRRVLSFSLPYLLAYFLQTLYGMADLFIVGQFDDVAATTAVSIGSQVMHMLTVMIVGLAMGSTVTIGQAVGAKDYRRAGEGIGNTATVFFLLSLVLTGVLLFLVDPIVAIMSTPAEAAAGTARYLTICFVGIPFITAYNIISAIFRGLGDSKSPMCFVAVACGVNIALDYLFIGALDMGPAGAALGTTLSQTVSVVIALFAMRARRREIPLARGDFKPRRGTMARLFRIGLPIAAQDGLIQVAFILITIVANRRGLTDAAAVGIVEKIITFLFLVPSSMLSTVSALGAQNIGAGKPRRARQTLGYAILIAAGFGLVVAVTMQFAAQPVVALFTNEETADSMAVIRLGGQYLRGYVWDCLFAGIHFSFSGYFCACGRAELSFLHNIAALALVRVPGVYLMSALFADTLYPMGLATAAGSLLSVLVCLTAYAVLRRGERRREARLPE